MVSHDYLAWPLTEPLVPLLISFASVERLGKTLNASDRELSEEEECMEELCCTCLKRSPVTHEQRQREVFVAGLTVHV